MRTERARLWGGHRILPVVLTLFAVFLTACATPTTRATPTRATVTSTPQATQSATPQKPGIYFGLMYPGTPDIAALNRYESQIGKHVSLVLWYQSWEQGGQIQSFPMTQLDAIRQHGSIPVLAWEPDDYPPPYSDPQFSLASISAGKWDSYIHQYANDAKAWGHPFFMRFASEMNGSWTPWSEMSNGNGPGQFVAAWRHVHDIFTSVGATNVSWVWCPNVGDFTTTPLAEIYPGDHYVDWVGMDGYNYSIDLSGAPWRSFATIFRSTYDQLVHLTPPGMPIMIGETGSVEDGGSKAGWIQDALTTQLPTKFPRVKALIWFDTKDGKFDLSYDTSSQALAAFRSAISLTTYEPNQYANLSQTPIPAPEVVAPPPSASPLASMSLIENVFTGPPPGDIQVVEAERSAPVRGAILLYQDGVKETTDARGVAVIPGPESIPVLERITVGSVVIVLNLRVDPQRGYRVLIDLVTASVLRVDVNMILAARSSLVELGLLGLLVFGAGYTLIKGSRIKSRERRILRQLKASSPNQH